MDRENKNIYDSDSSKEQSKADIARMIAGNISSNAAEDIRYRDNARRRSNVHTEFAAERAPVNNPYLAADTRSGGPNGTERRSNTRSGGPYDLYNYGKPADTRKKKNNTKGKKAAGASGKKKLTKAQKKKKHMRRVLAGSVVIVLILVGAGVGGVAWYSHGKSRYDGVFLDNTYINGTDVSRKTPKQAVELVTQDSDIPDIINLMKPDGEDVRIRMSDVGMKSNIKEEVEDAFKQQNHNDWFTARSEKSEYNFKVDFDFDRDEFNKQIRRKIIEGQTAAEPQDAYIERTSDGFEIVPEVVGTEIDEDKIQSLYDYIDGFLDRGEYSIDLSSCNCYKLPKVTALDLKEQLVHLDSLYDVEFTFDFGYAKEKLEGSEVIDWITFENDDASKGYTVDEDKAMAFVEKMADKYDTFGKDRTFKATKRGTITVEQGEGDYGWWIDQKKTCALLVDLIKDGISAETEPYYYVNPDSQYEYTCNPDVRTADDDIGNTYCEVDLKNQHFWYYEDGKLEYECDIVSGKPTAARNTPGGVYKLWYKELNKTLRGSTSDGETWETPVTYWNNISTFGVGLHDANWHPYFGGTRYVNYGSHGCVNMPVDAAKYVYDNIEIGTPVVMYW